MSANPGSLVLVFEGSHPKIATRVPKCVGRIRRLSRIDALEVERPDPKPLTFGRMLKAT